MFCWGGDVEGLIFSDRKYVCIASFYQEFRRTANSQELRGTEGLKEGHQRRLVSHLPEGEGVNLIPGQLVAPQGGRLGRWRLAAGITTAPCLGLLSEAA